MQLRTTQSLPNAQTPAGAPCPCLASLGPILGERLGGLDDPEGDAVAADLPPILDSHVHLFDDRTFARIWAWFEEYGWPIRYKLHAPEVIGFLQRRGVRELVGLCYSHRAGLARPMNRTMAALQAAHPGVIGLGTVLPGEPDAGAIAAEAFALGLHGLKLHCHVQCFAPDAPEMTEIYAACVAADKPLVMHAGREPSSPAYKCDVYALCGADRVAAVLAEWPGLKLVVPHLGADEFDAYARLLARHDNLWVDTTMMLAAYFPQVVLDGILQVRPDRVLYGSDFPNLPYAWDRELTRIAGHVRPDDLPGALGGNARALFGATPPSA